MKYLLIPCLFLFVHCTGSQSTAPAVADAPIVTPTSEVSARMTIAAQALLASFDDSLNAAARFAFEDDERYHFQFTPVPRKGADLRDMNPAQRKLVVELLQTILSEEGYRKATEIMQLEGVLKILEKRGDDDDRRDPEKYFVCVFGEPSLEKPWAWRFEGHHLSMSFSAVTGEVSVTPSFMGTNPAIVREGAATGTEVLKLEQDLGRKLVTLLDDTQKGKAIIADEAPQEIITGIEREARLEAFEGISVDQLSAEQREVLWQLIGVYLGNMEASVATERTKRLENIEVSQLYFAWAGGIEPGDAHYYRIHAPNLIIEYDNIQNDANHVHAVWRDPLNDFGEDLLRKHYEMHEH